LYWDRFFFGITESQLVFDISLHVGTLLAVFVVYSSDILAILRSVFNFFSRLVSSKPVAHLFKTDENLKLAAFIVIGSIPTAIIGLGLKQYEHFLFSSQILVGCMLILTGTILWLSRNFYFSTSKKGEFGLKKAVLIGITQGLAVIPGISRSGSTIAAGMFLGLDRQMAAKFSFLLCIPAIVGAELLGLKDIIENDLVVDPVTIYGTIAAFITGLIALKLLLKLVHSGKFHLFAPYCWLMGTLVLLSNII
jgi:undecaprenyl-diphosphatase